MEATLLERRNELEKAIPDIKKLSSQQKKLLKIVLKFGYASAFCERTADMSNSYMRAQRYRDEYEKIEKLLE